MIVISITAAMCMAVRWRSSPTILAKHWPGSTSHLGFGQPRSNRRRIFFAPVDRGGLPALRCRSMAVHDLPANLDIPPGREACRNDDPDSDGAPKGGGDTIG